MENNETASTALTGEKLLEKSTKWLERIKAAEACESDWCNDVQAAEKAYACDSK